MKSDSIIRPLLACVVGLVFASTGHAAAITVAPGISPAGGYLPLSAFGITPTLMGDEFIVNFDTPSFRFAGQSWNRIGVVSNGYLVIGGGTNADVDYENTNLPDATTAPANILAPFWTDLDPTSGGEIRLGVLNDGGDSWIVVDWNEVLNWSKDPGFGAANTFQVWIGLDTDANPAEDITFAYGAVSTGYTGLLTVGAQDASRTVGDTYYFNGVGTIPVNGTQLRVTSRDFAAVPVPEPSTLLLLGLSFAGFVVSRRRTYTRFD